MLCAPRSTALISRERRRLRLGIAQEIPLPRRPFLTKTRLHRHHTVPRAEVVHMRNIARAAVGGPRSGHLVLCRAAAGDGTDPSSR